MTQNARNNIGLAPNVGYFDRLISSMNDKQYRKYYSINDRKKRIYYLKDKVAKTIEDKLACNEWLIAYLTPITRRY
jgi:hypothetical protein